MLQSITTAPRKRRALPSPRNPALYARFRSLVDHRYKLKGQQCTKRFKYRCGLCAPGTNLRNEGYFRAISEAWEHIKSPQHRKHGKDEDLLELATLCDSAGETETTETSGSTAEASLTSVDTAGDSAATQLESASCLSDAADALTGRRASNHGLATAATAASVPTSTAGEAATSPGLGKGVGPVTSGKRGTSHGPSECGTAVNNVRQVSGAHQMVSGLATPAKPAMAAGPSTTAAKPAVAAGPSTTPAKPAVAVGPSFTPAKPAMAAGPFATPAKPATPASSSNAAGGTSSSNIDGSSNSSGNTNKRKAVQEVGNDELRKRHTLKTQAEDKVMAIHGVFTNVDEAMRRAQQEYEASRRLQEEYEELKAFRAECAQNLQQAERELDAINKAT